MPIPKTITVQKGRTVNIGNYNSVNFRYSITMELEQGDELSEAYADAEKIVDRWVDDEHVKWERD